MGEAKRKREQAYRDGPWPGSHGRCPRCFGTTVTTTDWEDMASGNGNFYAGTVTICVSCRIAWEPADEALIWDRSSPAASFSEPCGNCAFRPGSHEQRDIEEWKKTMAGLKAAGSFYCHKGVPLDPGGEHGFAYPKDPRQLRLCRGYLNTLKARFGRNHDNHPE